MVFGFVAAARVFRDVVMLRRCRKGGREGGGGWGGAHSGVRTDTGCVHFDGLLEFGFPKNLRLKNQFERNLSRLLVDYCGDQELPVFF